MHQYIKVKPLLALNGDKYCLIQINDISATVNRDKQLQEQIKQTKSYSVLLAQEMERIKVTLNSIADAVVATNENGLITLCNPVAEKLLAVSETEALLQPINKLFTLTVEGNEYLTLQCPVQECLDARKTIQDIHDHFLVNKNGDCSTITFSVAPIIQESGVLLGSVLVFRDVSLSRAQAAQEKVERTLIEMKLRRANNQFAIATSAAGIGFWNYDIASNSLNWDEWMFRLYGVTELDGAQPYALWTTSLHPEDRARAEQALNDALMGVCDFDTDFRVVHPNGEVKHLRAAATVMRDEEGKPLSMIGINFDITGLKLSEQRQTQLVKQLTSINDELNNFTFVASHDLKSPLRGIDQLAAWITEDLGDQLSGDSQQHLRLMRNRISRMDKLLDDLLAYARLGRSKQDVVNTDTRELVQNIFDLTCTTPAIELILSKDMPIITTYKVPLELVFRNLISNAIKHHNKSKGIIEVSALFRGNNYEFEIKDDGPGIAQEHHERVFGMFQTLKPRDEVEGSGIGLALVKKQIDSVGGSITLESDGEHGCTFRFTWPSRINSE